MTYTQRIQRPCPHHQRPVRKWDIARQMNVTEWCIECGGLGFVYTTQEVALGTDDAEYDFEMAAARAVGVLEGLISAQTFRSPESHEQAERIVAEYHSAKRRLAEESKEVMM